MKINCTLDWPFSQLLDCGKRFIRMNFILPHSFELDLPGIPLFSTLVELLFSYSNKVLRIIDTFIRIISSGSIWTLWEELNRQVVVLSHFWCSRLALFLCFYTGETSRLWWASVLLLSESRQSVRTVRVPYQPSVFAPFFLKSAGVTLFWASAVLLWFLA